jgi:tetratricopeptide (TPR) repeat protein
LSTPLTPARRFGVVVLALLAAAVLLRAQVADALVVRGDDLLYQNRRDAALVHYARALTIDPQSATAADRYIFVQMERHTEPALAEALSEASRYLGRHASDVEILADRAMCYLRTGRYTEASKDFARAGRLAKQPRFYVFAGWAAKRAHDGGAARRLWHAALALDSGYGPALAALRTMHS